REIAQNLGVADTDTLRKPDLIQKIIEKSADTPATGETHTNSDQKEKVAEDVKPRKRTRSVKNRTDSEHHHEVHLDNTKTFEFPEDNPAGTEEVAAQIKDVPATTEEQETKEARSATAPEPRKFERRQNQNTANQSKNQEPPINMDFDNVIVNE